MARKRLSPMPALAAVAILACVDPFGSGGDGNMCACPPAPPPYRHIVIHGVLQNEAGEFVNRAVVRVEAPFPGITACDFTDPYTLSYPARIGVNGEAFTIRLASESAAPNQCIRVVAETEGTSVLRGVSEAITAQFRDQKEVPDTVTVRIVMRPSS